MCLVFRDEGFAQVVVETAIGSPSLPDVMFVWRELGPGSMVGRGRSGLVLAQANLDMDEVPTESIRVNSIAQLGWKFE